ncbi:MAG: DHHA1 domain-containing protein, partial [Chloroflexota bacterium]|nr:DHHA1 domain-containing protein [Chloroflexota bacterium]
AISSKLQAPVAELETRLDNFLNDTEDLKRRLDTLERANLRTESLTILEQVKYVEGINIIASKTSATTPDAMREMGDFIKSQLSSVVIVLSSIINGNPILITMVSPDLINKGLHAGNIARDTSKIIGGGGGGQAEMAQAGGKDSSKLDFALSEVENLVRARIKS